MDKDFPSIPFQINPNINTFISNEKTPVSIKPIVGEVKRDEMYPVIFVHGVMGSRLFDKKGDFGKTYRQVWPLMVHPDEEPGTKGTAFQLDELNIKNTLYVPDFTIEQREGKKLNWIIYRQMWLIIMLHAKKNMVPMTHISTLWIHSAKNLMLVIFIIFRMIGDSLIAILHKF